MAYYRGSASLRRKNRRELFAILAKRQRVFWIRWQSEAVAPGPSCLRSMWFLNKALGHVEASRVTALQTPPQTPFWHSQIATLPVQFAVDVPAAAR
jgi:hypothetical protein